MSSNQSYLQEQYFIAWLANDARPLEDTHFWFKRVSFMRGGMPVTLMRDSDNIESLQTL